VAITGCLRHGKLRLSFDELLAAVDVDGRAGDRGVRHEVDAQCGDVGRAVAAADRQRGTELLAALVDPIAPGLATSLAWLAGWCAVYIATCARVIGGLPFARVTSGRVVAAAVICALLLAAYAWRRWRTS